jgi:arylsulfatase A-like enzyme
MSEITRRNLLASATAAPALSQTSEGPLNLIHIGVDTWGAHHTGAYGFPEYKTPHVDALLSRSAIFLDAYPQALPTIPSRRALYTGRQVFPSEKIYQPDDQVRIRGWHQLFAEDVTLSETLQQAGYMTAIVSDLYHQFKPGKNFTRGFDCWQWIRGQESDRYRSGPRKQIDLTRFSHPSQPIGRVAKPSGVYQYLINRQDWKSEEDWLAAQVFNTAARWLDDNAGEGQPFYLHIESFAPHEYWDPPENWYRLYMKKDYRGPRLIQPPLTTAKMSPLEVEHARALYAGLVSFTDDRIGRFLNAVDRLGLMKNTVIVFVADHGTMMGEQGQLHKGETRLRVQCTRVPFAIYHPRKDWSGVKIEGFVHHIDLMPTVLALLGQKCPARVSGQNLAPLLASREGSKRDSIVTGWGEHASLRTREWNYVTRWSPGTVFQELYQLKSDSLELRNVADQYPQVCAELRQKVMAYVEHGWATTKGTFAVHAT